MRENTSQHVRYLKYAHSQHLRPVHTVLPTMRFLSIVLLATALVLTITATTTQARRDRRKAKKLAGYGAPPPVPVYHTTTSTTAAPIVDLHNQEFCVDVSAYQPVVWAEREAEECSTVFVKQCQAECSTLIGPDPARYSALIG